MVQMPVSWLPNAVLDIAAMMAADRLTIESGTPEESLMAAAGTAVADAIAARWSPRPTLVLCGPGNNGGDGFVVARVLALRGWPIRVAVLTPIDRYRGAAAIHARAWSGIVEPASPDVLQGTALVVDALFGSGLSRPLDGASAKLVAAVIDRKIEVAAIDVPSGVAGDSGAVLGIAASAELTVTFCRLKPGHLLLPGRERCGETVIADIGISDQTVAAVAPRSFVNCPDLWRAALRRPQAADHKYRRGSLLIRGGEMTGAARLAAWSARRCGVGVATIAALPGSELVYTSDQPGLIVRTFPANGFAHYAAERHYSVFLIGPGNPPDAATKQAVIASLATQHPTVLDAGALTAFAGDVDGLIAAIAGPTVLTPHEGEFLRLFGAAFSGSKLDRARDAARRVGATILLKGADTVIAHPDGRAILNRNAPPTLATAGSGDILAGTIAALLGQGTPPFEAAAAAVWLNASAAQHAGYGVIAEDLPKLLASELNDVLTMLK